MEEGKILIINDQETVSEYIESVLSDKGYKVSVCFSAHQALNLLEKDSFELVVAKLDMPDLQGPAFIRQIKRSDKNCAVVVIIDKPSHEALSEIIKLREIYDYLTLPLNLERLYFVVKKGMEYQALLTTTLKANARLEEENTSLKKQNILLAKRIDESTKNLSKLYDDLRETYLRTIKSLAQAIDARDHYTHSHSENVAKYATAIAEAMHLSTKEVEEIREACELHDLGKIGIQDYILEKPGPLTPEEWDQIKKHSLKGAQILEPLTFLGDVVEIVRQHHERWDGKGYPEGKRGEEILLGARIVNLADSFEAMTSPRSYRRVPLTKQEAIEEIKKNSGSQFDPELVKIFLKILNKLHF